MEEPRIIFNSEKKKPLKIDGLEYFSANDFSLTTKEMEKARKELRETEDRKIRKLQELRDKLANDNDVNYRTDTPYLLRFLRIRKYNCSKAYQNLRAGYMFKKKHPNVSEIPEDLEKLLNLGIFNYLPYTDENGYVLTYINIENWKFEDMSFQKISQIINAVCNVITMNPRFQVNGTVSIWDSKGMTLQKIASILTHFGPKEFSFYLQNMYPWRLKKVLVLNTGQLTRLFFRLIRPVLSKKINERIILLGCDIKELHQYIDPVLLPKKLGGFLEENQCNMTQNILDNISYLKYDNSFS